MFQVPSGHRLRLRYAPDRFIDGIIIRCFLREGIRNMWKAAESALNSRASFSSGLSYIFISFNMKPSFRLNLKEFIVTVCLVYSVNFSVTRFFNRRGMKVLFK